MPTSKIVSLISGMVGRCAWIEHAAATVPPAAADRLDEVADRWNCWRLRSETPEQHRHRVQLHLTTLLIAIEDDLAVLDRFDRLARTGVGLGQVDELIEDTPRGTYHRRHREP